MKARLLFLSLPQTSLLSLRRRHRASALRLLGALGLGLALVATGRARRVSGGTV